MLRVAHRIPASTGSRRESLLKDQVVMPQDYWPVPESSSDWESLSVELDGLKGNGAIVGMELGTERQAS